MNKYGISAVVKRSKVDSTDEYINYAEENVYFSDFIDFLKTFEDDIVEATISVLIEKKEEK